VKGVEVRNVIYFELGRGQMITRNVCDVVFQQRDEDRRICSEAVMIYGVLIFVSSYFRAILFGVQKSTHCNTNIAPPHLITKELRALLP